MGTSLRGGGRRVSTTSKTSKTPINRDLEANLEEMRSRLGIDVSFDIVEHKLEIGGRQAAIYFIDGFIKDKVTADILTQLQHTLRPEMVPNSVEKLISRRIPYFEVERVESLEEAVEWVMTGPLVLFIDRERQAIVIDVREFPVRGIEEPDLEKVTRGAHEGLVETLVFNTAMVRRRLKDPRLRFEIHQVGTRSRTDVVIGYIDDLVDKDMVAKIQRRIKEASVDALPMGINNLEELIVKAPWNPLPRVRYTERPDVVVAHLLEGHVVVMVDTTPMAMILPVTLFHFFQHAEEFFQSPPIGTYLRGVRALAFFIATLLAPLWLALYLSADSLPEFLQFVGPKSNDSSVPIPMQFLILEFGVDLIRMALIHTPSALATSLGIVGAILLGDLAVNVGLFVPESILYAAVSAIGYFAIPSIEFGYAVRLFRYVLIVLVALFKLPGLLIGLLGAFIFLATSRSMGLPYLWPLIPFHGPSLVRALMRLPVSRVGQRPPLLGGSKADKTRTKGAKAQSPAQTSQGNDTKAQRPQRPRRRQRILLGPDDDDE